ncbi:MAG TPA: outer membrane beta-barrel protein, partial [Pseudodesulfovibrio sp.]|nr:outer membrane beta-barrel protein [Pseudodesulfovibrio sp.]
MRRIKILVGLLALLGTEAHAADMYVGAGLGAGMPMNADTSVRDARGALSNLGATTKITYDKVAVSPSILIGFDANRYFGAEFQYAYLGNYNLQATTTAGGVAEETDNVHAWSFSGVGKFWLGPKVNLLGKLGFADSLVDKSCSPPGNGCGSATDSAVGFVFGVGLALVPARELELRLDYT